MNKKVTLTVFLSLFILATLSTQFMMPVAATSKTIYVDASNASGPWDGTAEHPYKNITSGIEYASAGDTIHVRAGTYNESILINTNNLMLIGESREDTVINGGNASYVIRVTANNVTISGFTIKNGKKGIWLWNSNNNKFSDNTALNNQYGIFLDGSTDNSFSGNIVSDNSYGIYVYHSTSNNFSGNTALNNQNGIYLNDSSHNTLSGNTVSNNNYGIYASDSDSNVLSGNTALYNQYAGIYLDFSSNNVLSGNTASSNSYGFFLWESDNNLLSGNSISSNVYGIYFYYSSSNTVTYNDASNSQYGFYLLQSNDNIISQNNFINNTEQVSSIGSVNSWDNGVEGNYWSDYHGVDTNRDGIGDTPYIIDENNKDNNPLMARLLQFNIATEEKSYSITIVCNSTISNFQCRYDEYNRINAVSFQVNGTEGEGFCRICIPHALIEPPYTVRVDNNPPLYLRTVYKNGTHTWLYFTYKNSEHGVMVMHASSPEQFVMWSPWAILALAVVTVVLLSINIHYYRLFSKQKKVIQAYESELVTFPVSHSERARARFTRDAVERKEKIEKFKKKYGVKVYPASTLEELMKKLGVEKEKKKAKH
jgi:parallel beta-helix repeat protein